MLFYRAGSFRGAPKRVDESIRSGWQQLLEKTALPVDDYRPLPDDFYCPITFELIRDPKIDPDGYTYEGVAIKQWIEVNSDSPVTRKSLSVDQLYDNNAILSLLLEETDDKQGSIHASPRRWKQEYSVRLPASFETDVATSTSAQAQTQGSNTNVSSGQPYPTTHDELEERRRRVRRARQLGVAAFCLTLLIFFFFPTMCTFYLMCVGVGICCSCFGKSESMRRNGS